MTEFNELVDLPKAYKRALKLYGWACQVDQGLAS